MPKSIALVIGFVFLSLFSKAQQAQVTGIIKDTTSGNLVKNAAVLLMTAEDSTLQQFTRTASDGTYKLTDIPAGKYVFMVMHPSFADYVEDIDIKAQPIAMPTVSVTPKSKLLEAVIVRAGGAMRIKGDTTVYTADSFKVSANANVEELLRKMPGIQVDKNGEIKAMGETVEKVLVDGEEFFGDDPGMAVKNLRADAVKEVQVFKKKSDQAEFTGIDDGQSKQTINLKLKADKKNGYFGKIDAAGGLQNDKDDRYNSNIMYSTFKGKRKLSAFLLNGNTGQDGLKWEDREKFSSEDLNVEFTDDGGMMMFSNRGGDDEPNVDTRNGFFKNINAGINYNNTFHEKNKLFLSPKYNSQVYDNNKYNFSRTFVGDSVFNETSNSVTHVNRWNIKTTGSYDMKLDSNNSLKISVNASQYHTQSEEQRLSQTTGETGNMKNARERSNSLESEKQAMNISAIYRKKFKKNRRTLSLNADWRMIQSNSDNYVLQDITDFANPAQSETIDQLIGSDKRTNTVSAKLTYTEPLSKKYSLELSHQFSLNKGQNDQRTFNYSAGSDKYDVRVDSLTNDFDQSIWVNQPTIKIAYNTKKVKFNFGVGAAFSQFDLLNNTDNVHLKRNYTNFFPTAMYNYTYKSNSNLSVSYNGRTQQPSLYQLQPVPNIIDKYNQYIGNPNLKQSFSHSFNVNHNSYNFLKEIWMYQGLYGNLTNNSITNSRVYDPASGATTSQPINTNGNFNTGLYGGIGFKWKKPALQLNVNVNANYSRFADFIQNKKSFSRTSSISISPSVGKFKDKKYNFNIFNRVGYNYNKNAQFTSGGNSFMTNTLGFDGGIYYKKVWQLSSDYEFNYQGKVSADAEPFKFQSWNARLQRTFKKDEFTAYLLVRDILNQNIGISRNFSGNNYFEQRDQRLQRYWMLGFTWNFKNKAPKAKEETTTTGATATPSK